MKIAVGALALLVVAATASGDSNTYNYQDNGTAKFNTRSGQIVDASGNAKVVDADRDRDYSTPLTLLSATPLTAGSTKGGASAISVSEYTRLGLMLRWTMAAADSDSVNIVVKVFAKRSSTMDDGMNHLWTGMRGDTATIYRGAGTAGGVTVPVTFYVTRNRQTGLKLEGSTAQNYTLPPKKWVWAGNGGVYIPLQDCGAPFNGQYIGVEITNANNTKDLTTITAEVWPKVN